MGIKLIVEVLDHWNGLLTAGERDDLLVIAENANDKTRETYGPVHESYILRRAGKSARSWKNSIGALMRKKVLEYATRDGRELSGHRNQYAVYRLATLCPEPPHDGWRGHCTRPERVTPQVTQSEERVTPQVTQSEERVTPQVRKGHPTGDPFSSYSSEDHSSLSRADDDAGEEREIIDDEEVNNPTLAAAERIAVGAGVVTAAEAPQFVAWVTQEHKPRAAAWWRAVAANGDMPGLADAWRAQPKPAPAWCGECGDGNPHAKNNPHFRTRDGQPCHICHPRSAP